MGGTKVSDVGLKDLRGTVSKLDLGSTLVSDAGMTYIKRLAGLEALDLDHTRITDAGLEQLLRLEYLTRIRIDHTHVTDAGVKKLQDALPKAEIIY